MLLMGVGEGFSRMLLMDVGEGFSRMLLLAGGAGAGLCGDGFPLKGLLAIWSRRSS